MCDIVNEIKAENCDLRRELDAQRKEYKELNGRYWEMRQKAASFEYLRDMLTEASERMFCVRDKPLLEKILEQMERMRPRDAT